MDIVKVGGSKAHHIIEARNYKDAVKLMLHSPYGWDIAPLK